MYYQRSSQDPSKYQRWGDLQQKPLAIVAKLSFFDVSVVLVTIPFTMSGEMHLLACPKSCE